MGQKAYIQMDQGTDFVAQIDLNSYQGVPYDLSDSTLIAKMKKSWMSTAFHEFDAYVLDAANGSLIIEMTWDKTSAIDPGRYLYDIIATDSANRRMRVIEGVVHVTPGISDVTYPYITSSATSNT